MALAAYATTAVAAGPPATQATDPNANSPAGAIYSIPLDNARQDGAPHGHSGVSGGGTGSGGGGGGGTGSGGGGGGGTGSGGGASGGGTGGSGGGGGAAGGGSGNAGGGSSSTGGTGSGNTSNAVLVPGGQPGSLVHSSNGFGSSSSVPGLNAPASAGFRAVQSNASDAPMFAILLALGVIGLGAFVGARAWRLSHARAGAFSPGEPPQLPPPSSP
jgi:hypothetical protein